MPRNGANHKSIRPLLRMTSTKTVFSHSIVHSFMSLHMYNANLHGFFAPLIFLHSRVDIAPAHGAEKSRSRRLEISGEKICHSRYVFVLNRDLKKGFGLSIKRIVDDDTVTFTLNTFFCLLKTGNSRNNKKPLGLERFV